MEGKDKLVSLFKYIKELYELRYRTVSNIRNQEWHIFIKDIPNDEKNISLNYVDRVEEEIEEGNGDTVLLEVAKPEFQKCPSLPISLQSWVQPGWERFKNETQKIDVDEGTKEKFEDSSVRVRDWDTWNVNRNQWVTVQIRILKTRQFFNDLFTNYIKLENNSETLEFMVGQGILTESDPITKIHHPILLKRLRLSFNSETNIIRILDTDVESELYTMLFKMLDYINHDSVKELKEQLSKNFYHPLDRNDTPLYLKALINLICSESKYVDGEDEGPFYDKLLLYSEPVFFVRKKIGGVSKAIDDIVEQIEKKGTSPGPLLNLIGEDEEEQDIADDIATDDEKLSALNGEDKEILFAKEANREQLAIAKDIENNKVVLVKGPPGTGKTHTIGNLTGHFLAQGKSVLITSHTKKALKVVKSNIPEGLRNLCVSVLDDSNKDMEGSIEGISEIISKYSSKALLKEAQRLKVERNKIIDELIETRKKITKIKFMEYKSIIINGKDYSPQGAADFVNKNSEKLSYIPGKIPEDKPLPLTLAEFDVLYKSNGNIEAEEQVELEYKLPNPDSLIEPTVFNRIIDNLSSYNKRIEEIVFKLNRRIEIDIDQEVFLINDLPLASIIDMEEIQQLEDFLNSIENNDEWLFQAVLDGKKGDGYKTIWINLLDKIKAASQYAEQATASLIGKRVVINSSLSKNAMLGIFSSIVDHFNKGRKLTRINRWIKPEWKYVLDSVSINGESISSKDDCVTVIRHLSLQQKRIELGIMWDDLISKNGGPSFESYGTEPERSCLTCVARIERHLNWSEEVLQEILARLIDIGINPKVIFQDKDFIVEEEDLRDKARIVEQELPLFIEAIDIIWNKIADLKVDINEAINILENEELKHSIVCKNMRNSLESHNTQSYTINHTAYEELYGKYKILSERERLLLLLEKNAPDWSNQIRHRIGIHGLDVKPDAIAKAWECKQCAIIIDQITEEPFEYLQQRLKELNNILKIITTDLIKYLSWHHLLVRIENDRDKKQALQGWKLTVKKIGKGTGKNAPMHKRHARKLMAKCQTAVPAWIMTINKALESLDPKSNKFDVVIIDEASQSDISALAIMYLAEKVIVVGDDEQVSPSGIGVDIGKSNALVSEFIKDIIPNYHLYDMKTSLYDIVNTTYRSLMLLEHFRCVPDIIGYSNKLSYDFKIKPLRDESSTCVKPSTVTYRVDGVRNGSQRTNLVEARSIVALMLACIEQPEYKNMTFGVITLLGNMQDVLINNLILKKISIKEYEKRDILCGTPPHFQGTQRDIIFLSMVDNNSNDTPLRLVSGSGRRETKQRYNVATSRAKDQLWVVHSLDVTQDLKNDDLRKDLLEYMADPKSFKNKLSEIEEFSESPFEKSVAQALVSAGYHISQQWEVGSYRIDIVVLYEGEMVAIECDGNKFHSGEEQVLKDMERQIILIRLGWRFIRIRGSEYYRSPQEAMKRIFSELKEHQIFPESIVNNDKNNESELLDRVKIRASQIIDAWKEEGDFDDDIREFQFITTPKVELENEPDDLNGGLRRNKKIQDKKRIAKDGIGVMQEKVQEKIKEMKPSKKVSAKPRTDKKRLGQMTFEDIETQSKSRTMKKKSIGLINIKSEPEQNKHVAAMISELKKTGFSVIDNLDQSGIIWVLGEKEHKCNIEAIVEPNFRVVFEKRGSKVTGGKAAWRIMQKLK
jgi:very-short-patch-repair endonuclease/DNA replication protein DnaC